jgi:hypothetical protein
MPYLDCLACSTRLYRTDCQADPIGDLCPDCGSLLEPVGDLGEIVRFRVIETRGSTSQHSTSSTSPDGASRAGRLIVGRVREIIARGELKHAPIRPESKAATLTLSAQQSESLALALPARATKP